MRCQIALKAEGLSEFGFRSGELMLKLRTAHHVAHDDLGRFFTGWDIHGIMIPADYAVVPVFVGARVKGVAPFWNHHAEDEGAQIPGGAVATGVRILRAAGLAAADGL